jgi:hypothetical protein
MLDRVQALEAKVKKLDRGEFERFSSWFAEYEASAWDEEIGRDFAAGKLDFLIDEARRERNSGTLTDI